jgi:hypothetical protein
MRHHNRLTQPPPTPQQHAGTTVNGKITPTVCAGGPGEAGPVPDACWRQLLIQPWAVCRGIP